MRWTWIALVALACNTSDDTDGKDQTGDTDPTDATDEPTDTQPTDTDTDDAGDPCLAQGTTALQIGTGEDAFEAVTAGAALRLVHGPQGGWHHTVAIHIDNAPQFLVIRTTVTDVDSGEALTVDKWDNVAMVADGGAAWACSGSFSGIEARIDATKLGADPADSWCGWRVLEDRDTTVRVEVKTPDDVVIADETLAITTAPDACDADPFSAGCACDPAATRRPPDCTGDDPYCEDAYNDTDTP